MKSEPLAHLLRPSSLDDYVGQSHLVGLNKPLRKTIEQQKVFSMIFWGPPGVGKTTLAKIIAQATKRDFFELSAVSAGKQELRDIIEQASSIEATQKLAPVVFLDEIHRFNKSQQDFLLPYVENGTIILIGATTENPSFEVISALLSRTRVFVLKSLSQEELLQLMNRAVVWLNDKHTPPIPVQISIESQDWLLNYSNGDARKMLTLLDHTFQTYQEITVDSLKATAQSNQLRYDKTGEEHHDTISAFIKSMRASNPDAALYYLARMVEAGEDPKFIARRMVIFASEDVGIAQPTALVVANAVFTAVTTIGYPEAQINLAHGTVYLATAKKNRAAYDAYFAALADVKQTGNLSIPLNLRNAVTSLMKAQGYGKDYQMYPDHAVSLLPKELGNKKYLVTQESTK